MTVEHHVNAPTDVSSKRRTNRPIVTLALMLGMFLAAVEGTIVATAMPSIVSSLGGFALYNWVFSIYLLTEAAAIPIYGKLADIFGRKPVFIWGTSLFMLGTALCGQSANMMQLILFRGIQGLGSGAVLPLASTMVGDLYSLEERPKVQGVMSSVWALASVIGPALGGFIVDFFTWHWIFYINIPFGLAAIAVLALFFHEDVERTKPQIDYAGAFLLVLGTGALLTILMQGGTAWPWASKPVVILALTAVIGWALFIWQEKRAPEPLLPLDLMGDRTILVCNLGSLFGGGLIFGLASFIPTFAQGVLGLSATRAGALLAFMSIGWPLASTLTGRVWGWIGHRSTAILGTFLTFASGIILSTVDSASPAWLLGVGSFIMGMGLGFSQTTYVVTVQTRVSWNRRGVATSSNMFARILGSTVWVALLGGILNHRLYGSLAGVSDAVSEGPRGAASDAGGTDAGIAGVDVVNHLLDAESRAMLAPDLLSKLQDALAAGIHHVFLFVMLTGAAAFALSWNLPKESLSDTHREDPRDPDLRGPDPQTPDRERADP